MELLTKMLDSKSPGSVKRLALTVFALGYITQAGDVPSLYKTIAVTALVAVYILASNLKVAMGKGDEDDTEVKP